MSKRLFVAGLFVGYLLQMAPAAEAAPEYNVGDRVKIGDDYGTVIQIGPPVYGGGHQVKVHLDKLGPDFPDTGSMYDPVHSTNIKPAGAGAPPAPGPTPGVGAPPALGAAPGGVGGFVSNAVQAAKNFVKGQRVFIGNMNEWGTVVGPGIGPNLVRVHLDRFGASKATVDFDPITSKLAAAGAPQAPTDPGAAANHGGGADPATNAAHSVPDGQGTRKDIKVPDNAPPTDETLKNLIKANYPPDSYGETVFVNFQNYARLAGPVPYEDKFQGHLNQETVLGGAGHVYQAYKVHARFTVIHRYDDPHADDNVRTYESDYYMFKDNTGHWKASDQNMVQGDVQFVPRH